LRAGNATRGRPALELAVLAVICSEQTAKGLGLPHNRWDSGMGRTKIQQKFSLFFAVLPLETIADHLFLQIVGTLIRPYIATPFGHSRESRNLGPQRRGADRGPH